MDIPQLLIFLKIDGHLCCLPFRVIDTKLRQTFKHKGSCGRVDLRVGCWILQYLTLEEHCFPKWFTILHSHQPVYQEADAPRFQVHAGSETVAPGL